MVRITIDPPNTRLLRHGSVASRELFSDRFGKLPSPRCRPPASFLPSPRGRLVTVAEKVLDSESPYKGGLAQRIPPFGSRLAN
jgi:hypothetical protein